MRIFSLTNFEIKTGWKGKICNTSLSLGCNLKILKVKGIKTQFWKTNKLLEQNHKYVRGSSPRFELGFKV